MLLITQAPQMESECSVQEEKTPIHPQFNDSEADVTFQSVDGILFNLRRKYLELNTGAFPGAEFDTKGEITHLTETSKVLEVLFQFVYPKEQPDVEELSFMTLAGVAEAAEKYEVYAAMNICKLQMKRFLPEHALGILAHASKHDYPKLVQEAVPHLARVPLVKVLEVLPPQYVLPFVRYHESWNRVFEDALKAIIEMKVASPSNPRQHWYFERSLTPQACHSCMMSLVTGTIFLRLTLM
ncbi:hypothetical protein NLJ89_g6579 [Agrocybe chaxingu]|uniref:BTB domain-containing protein n=1 Tax=Agrocybe chaxingu TaxID=84603 RepID=A0A9W8MUH8_9AGAR|nr:hypothetical protein NLJ89_g6579 [Agrocybe chaxingu]